MQIFLLIPCKSLWDFICQVSWVDKIFTLCWTRSLRSKPIGSTEIQGFLVYSWLSSRSHRRKRIGVTDFNSEKMFCHFLLPIFFSSTQWFFPSICILSYIMLACVSQGSYSLDSYPWKLPFLEIDVKGGERAHQSLFSQNSSKKGRDMHCHKRSEVTCLW